MSKDAQKPAAATPVALKPGEIVTVGRRIYGCCPSCHAIIRMDKPLIGALHVCA